MMMKNSYLIQRLNKPLPDNTTRKILNAFSFGGGLRNGGLTDQARELLGQIFDFDYMGSAEFEWGIVPQALTDIFNNKEKLVTGNVEVKAEAYKWENLKMQTIYKTGIVYYLCPKEYEEEVKTRIKLFAKNSQKIRTKEGVFLNNVICNQNERVAGWLELDNGYFFFTDKEMFEKTCQLFDIKEMVTSK